MARPRGQQDDKPTAEDALPSLRPLSPEFQKDRHGFHVDLLLKQLRESTDHAPRNIAVSGHYGSGKSSVIGEVEKLLRKNGHQVINVSLPSLGLGHKRSMEGEDSVEESNLIQKEIVKQLLYRKTPASMPASRYRRLDSLRWQSVAGESLIIALLVGTVGLLTDLPSRIRSTLPDELVGDFVWLPWGGLAAIAVMTGAIWVLPRRFFHHVRISEVAAGPTKVSLDDRKSSYFDEYLDEIVYFFHRSKTSVVVFEDLDRFRDPHIFESLRELNAILNTSDQLKARPVRFIYAIRDSIFESLDVDASSNANRDSALGVDETMEWRRLKSTTRTKFFDLVIPMVPFISHVTSRDLLHRELQQIPDPWRPTGRVVNLVGSHLTDMRLIKNICNEHEIFARRILPPHGLEKLGPDQLFAMMTYKNVYLGDFEKMREGTSRLDTLYDQYRKLVSHNTARADRAAQQSRAHIEHLDGFEFRSARYGRRLIDVLKAAHQGSNPKHADIKKIAIGGHAYTKDDLTSPDFWQTAVATDMPLQVYFRDNSHLRFKCSQIEILMDETLPSAAWSKEDRAAHKEAEREAQDLTDFLIQASLADLIGRDDLTVTYNKEKSSLQSIVDQIFIEDPLAVELITAGYIDDNYTLYIADFHGISISVSAMNFILHAVRSNTPDVRYHFDTPGDITAVIEQDGDRLFRGKSVYNVEIFDYLLGTRSEALAPAITHLAESAETRTQFLDIYIIAGAMAPDLVQRLSSQWSGIFHHIAAFDGITPERRDILLNAALLGAHPTTAYETGSAVRKAIEGRYQDLPAFREPVTAPLTPNDLGMILSRLGVTISDLTPVEPSLRAEIVTHRIYPITMDNISAATGQDTPLSLDVIKSADPGYLYTHVLYYLDDYLAEAERTGVPTVLNADAFLDILIDISDRQPQRIEDVARRANTDCLITDLAVFEEDTWPAIVRAGRIEMTVANVDVYLNQHGMDPSLANMLTQVREISGLSDDKAARKSLAVTLINSQMLNASTKVALVNSLDLAPETIAPDTIINHALELIPTLVTHGLVADEADAFHRIAETAWMVKKNLIKASSTFPHYLPQLTLSESDVTGISTLPHSRHTNRARSALIEHLLQFSNQLQQQSAAALTDWANKQAFHPSPEALRLLTEFGADVQSILKLLSQQVSSWNLSQITPVLQALGEPYSTLTTANRKRPKFPDLDGSRAVISRLMELGIVSSVWPDDGELQVVMKGTSGGE